MSNLLKAPDNVHTQWHINLKNTTKL